MIYPNWFQLRHIIDLSALPVSLEVMALSAICEQLHERPIDFLVWIGREYEGDFGRINYPDRKSFVCASISLHRETS
jgi:hypothetical protein